MSNHYNDELIAQRIEEFKKEFLTYDGPKYVMFDADNTLIKFSTYGKIEEAMQLCYNRGFYKNLPAYEEAEVVVECLQRLGFIVGIISAYIDTPFCYKEKMESFKYHFPTIKEEDIILVAVGSDKSSYIRDLKHTVVVDDFHRNVSKVYAAGGLAIKKSYSGKPRPVPSITSLIELFPLLHELNMY